jgi:phosphomevalonate kinase
VQAFLDAMVDLDTFSAQTANADLPGAKATLASLSSHVGKALQLASAPGLPSELHNLMVDLQTLLGDFGKLLDAAGGGNDQAVISAEASIQADADKIGTYNFDKISTEIDAYYKPLVDSFNSEMAKATAA